MHVQDSVGKDISSSSNKTAHIGYYTYGSNGYVIRNSHTRNSCKYSLPSPNFKYADINSDASDMNQSSEAVQKREENCTNDVCTTLDNKTDVDTSNLGAGASTLDSSVTLYDYNLKDTIFKRKLNDSSDSGTTDNETFNCSLRLKCPKLDESTRHAESSNKSSLFEENISIEDIDSSRCETPLDTSIDATPSMAGDFCVPITNKNVQYCNELPNPAHEQLFLDSYEKGYHCYAPGVQENCMNTSLSCLKVRKWSAATYDSEETDDEGYLEPMRDDDDAFEEQDQDDDAEEEDVVNACDCNLSVISNSLENLKLNASR